MIGGFSAGTFFLPGPSRHWGFFKEGPEFFAGPSRISAFFKEGPGFSAGTFQELWLFQGRSYVFCPDLPGFRAFSRKVLGFLPGPSRNSGLFKEGPEFSARTFQEFGPFQGRS